MRAFYESFFAEMLPKVYVFIRVRFDAEGAEELAAETLATVWRKQIPVPRDETELLRLRALTYTVARGHIANARAKSEREERNGRETMPRVAPGDDPTFEAVLPAVLKQAIGALEPRDREALALRIAGYSTGEVAEILGITPKAASMRLARAKERLTGRLAEDEKKEVTDDVTI